MIDAGAVGKEKFLNFLLDSGFGHACQAVDPASFDNLSQTIEIKG
jgi:hypothetical protein